MHAGSGGGGGSNVPSAVSWDSVRRKLIQLCNQSNQHVFKASISCILRLQRCLSHAPRSRSPHHHAPLPIDRCVLLITLHHSPAVPPGWPACRRRRRHHHRRRPTLALHPPGSSPAPALPPPSACQHTLYHQIHAPNQPSSTPAAAKAYGPAASRRRHRRSTLALHPPGRRPAAFSATAQRLSVHSWTY